MPATFTTIRCIASEQQDSPVRSLAAFLRSRCRKALVAACLGLSLVQCAAVDGSVSASVEEELDWLVQSEIASRLGDGVVAAVSWIPPIGMVEWFKSKPGLSRAEKDLLISLRDLPPLQRTKAPEGVRIDPCEGIEHPELQSPSNLHSRHREVTSAYALSRFAIDDEAGFAVACFATRAHEMFGSSGAYICRYSLGRWVIDRTVYFSL